MLFFHLRKIALKAKSFSQNSAVKRQVESYQHLKSTIIPDFPCGTENVN